MAPFLYILIDRKPIVAESEMQWSQWMFDGDFDKRRVAETRFGNVRVSTVFLGLDHGFGTKPVLFETMVFGGDFDGKIQRYCTWEDAETGHNAILSQINAAQGVRFALDYAHMVKESLQ